MLRPSLSLYSRSELSKSQISKTHQKPQNSFLLLTLTSPRAIPFFPGMVYFVVFVLFSICGTAAGQNSRGGGVQLWCVAKNNADDVALQYAIDWACGAPPAGGVDCAAVQQGGVCFLPDDIQFHASYAFNEYYRRKPTEPGACDFAGTAILTQLDPSRNMAGVDSNCKFPPSFVVTNGSITGSAPDVLLDLNSMGFKLTNHWAVTLGLCVVGVLYLLG